MDEIKNLKEVVKEKLGDMYTPEIETKLGDVKVLTDPKNFIPLSKLDVANETIKTLREEIQNKEKFYEETLTAKEKDLKDVKKKAEGNEELVKQIDELQKSYKAEKEARESEREAEKAKTLERETLIKKTYSLKAQLMNAGIEDETAREILSKIFDLSKLELDENEKLKGFDDLLKPIKENPVFAPMFGKEVIAGQEHQESEQNAHQKYYTREQVQKMTPEQVKENIEVINESMSRW